MEPIWTSKKDEGERWNFKRCWFRPLLTCSWFHPDYVETGHILSYDDDENCYYAIGMSGWSRDDPEPGYECILPSSLPKKLIFQGQTIPDYLKDNYQIYDLGTYFLHACKRKFTNMKSAR